MVNPPIRPAECLSVWPFLREPETPENGGGEADREWPRISIVTPNFNYGHLVEMTMRSILLQGYPNLEYIVIDDGSTDNSLEVIGKYQSQLAYFEHQPNQGQYPAINKGFTHATGEVCGWLNSDDIYLPWTLRAVASIFRQFPEVDWIAGTFSAMQDAVVHRVHTFQCFPRAMIRAGMFHSEPGGYGFIQQESCFWRRRLWEQAGGLRTDLRYASDFELWTRFSKYADLYAVTTLLGGFTIRMGQNRSLANNDRYLGEVRSTIARVRGEGRSEEARLARRLDRFTRVRGLLTKHVARRVVPVENLRGPTVTWDFARGCYAKGSLAFF